MTKAELHETLDFICEYAATLSGSGAYTSRVVRNAKRIAAAAGVRLGIITSHASIIVSVEDSESGLILTKIEENRKSSISFELNANLCRLSWRAVDESLPLAEIKRRYSEILKKPKMDTLFTLFIVGFANASFCRLFNGDFLATAIVFSSTLVGFSVKLYMQKKAANEYITFITSAFAASICAAAALCFECESETALATSPLFLIPGVPLINGIIDILDGFTLSGVNRLIKAALLIICIAVGLSLTLLMVRGAIL